jgi:hypothetical protein
MFKMQSQPLDALVWAVQSDAANGVLAIQLRDGAQKSACFCLLDLPTGLLGPMISLENGWWTELLGVSGQLLHIGRYGDPALPVITETVTVDGRQAMVVEGHPWEADSQDLQLPSNVLAAGAELAPPPLPGTWVAELHAADLHLRAWHGDAGNGTDLMLGIWEDAKLQFQIVLEQQMDKLNPSPFFLAGNWLVFIRNRNEICWIDLGGQPERANS